MDESLSAESFPASKDLFPGEGPGQEPTTPEQPPTTPEQPPQPLAKEEVRSEFDEAEAIINEITDLLKMLATTPRYAFLVKKFSEKFPDKVRDLNGVVGAIIDGFKKSIEIK